MSTLPDFLTGWAAQDPDALAITFLDHSERPGGRRVTVTWRQLDDRVNAVAAHLQSQVDRGDRVAIVADQTPGYIAAFLGVLRAGAVAVPLSGPDLPGHEDRLAAVLADSGARLQLSTVDEMPDARPEPVELREDDLAYLQYTSGSTGMPRGVEITHRNVVANARQACAAYGVTRGHAVTVSWLPLCHDMGLMLSVAGPLVAGTPTVLLRPLAFLERPVRWLDALSTHPGAVTAAPSFAYAYSAARVRDEDKVRLRLDAVQALVDGSEPVQPAAFERFRAAFASCGLRPDVHRPSYGLAEATVFVTAGNSAARKFDRVGLTEGRLAEATGPEAVDLVPCGRSIGQDVLVVDPATAREMPDDTVGEIWVSGPNVGRGYWNRPQETEALFGARLAGRPEAGPWLRTGDLGAWHEEELYVTGRIKDLIIVDGRNHYPQDVEQTVEGAHPAIRLRNSVAFALQTDAGERAVVLAERSRQAAAGAVDPAHVAESVRVAVARRHGLALHDVRLVEPDSLPRTSSGKIARSACRAGYLAELS